MKVVITGDIYGFLSVCAPFETAISFDNTDFLVGEREIPVFAVLLALDITPDVVGEVVRPGAKLIISHHPVTFQPLRCMGPQDVLHLLVQRGVGAVCAHTNLDLAPDGVNTYLVEALGLGDIYGVKPYGTNRLWEGLIGNLPRRNSPAEFAEYVRQALNCGGLKYVNGGEPVQTVALCGGAGVNLLKDTVQIGTDALIMASTEHHQLLLTGQLGIILVGAGYFSTEGAVILPLKGNLQEQFPTVHFQKPEVLCNPAQYL